MASRRFTRKTNAFSKSLTHHRLAMALHFLNQEKSYMSWKSMDTAPKDGTVIIVYADFSPIQLRPDVFHAFYSESEDRWDTVIPDEGFPFNISWMRKRAILLGWIEVPHSSPIAGKKAKRDGELAREPTRLRIY